ncbi:hypothetical protein QYE76_014718 [Lolium multiflorum]|uniref:Uncharacterized protein n=1 Tax=Lolium multiflorum TaxID=4521 RepID=A0AAD8U314_LOLMU|nr:hypothetical protein QYE76_014718 [Lolium multiflorum]
MVKKKSSAATSGIASSSAVAKATADATKRVAPEVSAAASKDAPGDWPASTMMKRDEKKARGLGFFSLVIITRFLTPNPPAGFTVMFVSFLYRGLSLLAHEFLRRLLHTYGIQLWQLMRVDVHFRWEPQEEGIDPHWGLWKKIFFVERYNSSSGSFVTGGVGFVVRKEVNYFNFPMRESVQGCRLKWFYLKYSSATNMCLPKFVDVLEAVPKKSWKNILTSEEKPVVDKLFDRIIRIKESDGQTMMGTKIVAVFLKRHIQPVMSRAHQMWLYSGPKDETRINVAELSEKELLDEVRCFNHFSQEDSIPLLALLEPYDFEHQPTEVPSTAECFPTVSEENLKEGDFIVSIESCAEDNEVLEEEDNDPVNPEAFSADHRSFADDLSDTAESNHDNDVDRAPSVDAALEKTSAQPPKRPSGGFADEDDLLDFDDRASFEEGEGEPQQANSRSLLGFCSTSSCGCSTFNCFFSFKGERSSFSSCHLPFLQRETNSLKKEFDQLEKKLKEEEKEKAEGEAQRKEREDFHQKYTLAPLEAADIPVGSLGKLPDGSSVDALSMAIKSDDLIRALLRKNKGVMSRLHAMIFLKANQENSLGQLTDTFSVDTEGTIEDGLYFLRVGFDSLADTKYPRSSPAGTPKEHFVLSCSIDAGFLHVERKFLTNKSSKVSQLSMDPSGNFFNQDLAAPLT